MNGKFSRVIGLTIAIASVLSIAPALALTGSAFEEADGNLVVDGAGKQDWISFAPQISCATPFAGCAIDLPTGATDDSFTGGSKDDSSTVKVETGSIPNNKSNLERAYVASDLVGNQNFLYVGWVRNNTLGTANFSIELNQVAQSGTPTPGSSYTINRTAGDLLVLFDLASGGKAEKVQLGLSRWVTAQSAPTGSPKADCQANSSYPCWGKTKDLDAMGAANGSVNTGLVPVSGATSDVLFPEPAGSTPLAALTFGEAAINLTQAGVLGKCEGFGSFMIRSRSSSAFNAELKDFIAPGKIAVQLPVDTSQWKSNGEAMTLKITDSDPSVQGQAAQLNAKASTASSTQTGPGTTSDGPNQKGPLDLPLDDSLKDDGNPLTPEGPGKGDVAHVDLLTAQAKSIVQDGKAAATPTTTQDSIALAAGVNVLKGTVKADVVKSLAMTEARATGATPDTGFSGIKNLQIDVDGPGGAAPVAMNNVAPNTKIDLSPVAFGPDSYVEVRREKLTTEFPPPGTALGTAVTFEADVVEITGLHVHITDRTPDNPPVYDDGNVTLDVLIASSKAHSESDGILCKAVQKVEADATILKGNVGNLAGASIGSVAIPEGGGASHQELDGFTLGAPPLATLGLSPSHAEGGWSDTATEAFAFAHVNDLCVDLTAAAGCEVSADVVKSDVSSTASAASKTSTGGASFVKLKILGQEVEPQPGVLQQIPGVGVVAVNERDCHGGTLSGGTCTSAGGDSTEMTVRALHIKVTELLPAGNPLGLKLGSELVIAEAHSGATFVAVP